MKFLCKYQFKELKKIAVVSKIHMIVFNKEHCTQHNLCKNRATKNRYLLFLADFVNKHSSYDLIGEKERNKLPSKSFIISTNSNCYYRCH